MLFIFRLVKIKGIYFNQFLKNVHKMVQEIFLIVPIKVYVRV